MDGIGMMLKSFGVDPKMFEQVGKAIKTVVETLGAIKKQNDEILALLRQERLDKYGPEEVSSNAVTQISKGGS